MIRLIKNIFIFINLVAIVALGIAYSSVYIPPDKFWPPAIFGMAYPYIIAVNLFFIILWIIIKPRWALLSAISILAGWNFIPRYIQFDNSNKGNGEIKLVSYNVQYFTGDKTKSQKENANEIVSFLNGLNADIICLQEARLRKNKVFNLANTVKSLNSIAHYQYARSSSSFGSVTMTRYPIVNMGEIRFDNSNNMTIFTDVVIGTDTVRIFNIHLQSYMIDPRKYSIIDSLGANQEEDIKEMREMGGKLKRAFEMRTGQVRKIRKYINESPYKIIVCGDFNDTPVSFAYQTIKQNLTDAFVNSGKGFGRTYIGKLPSFRIDNIFYDNGFESYNFKTYDFRESDHLPISCELKIKRL